MFTMYIKAYCFNVVVTASVFASLFTIIKENYNLLCEENVNWNWDSKKSEL